MCFELFLHFWTFFAFLNFFLRFSTFLGVWTFLRSWTFLWFWTYVILAVTPPYNKVVLLIFCLLLILFIICCCGMSNNLNKEGPQPIAASSLSFSLFTLIAALFVAFGFYQEGNGIPNMSLSWNFLKNYNFSVNVVE